MRWPTISTCAVALALVAGCADDAEPATQTTAPNTPSTVTTSTSPISTSAPDPLIDLTEEQAASAFTAAWMRGDKAQMAAIARPDDLVDQALRLGTPSGPAYRINVIDYVGPDASPQVQAVVRLTNGRQAYLIMRGPGTGVNWVADYVAEEGGTDDSPTA